MNTDTYGLYPYGKPLDDEDTAIADQQPPAEGQE